MTKIKNHDQQQAETVIGALERLIAEPTGVNMVRYSDLALPFNVILL